VRDREQRDRAASSTAKQIERYRASTIGRLRTKRMPSSRRSKRGPRTCEARSKWTATGVMIQQRRRAEAQACEAVGEGRSKQDNETRRSRGGIDGRGETDELSAMTAAVSRAAQKTEHEWPAVRQSRAPRRTTPARRRTPARSWAQKREQDEGDTATALLPRTRCQERGADRKRSGTSPAGSVSRNSAGIGRAHENPGQRRVSML